MHDGEHTLVLVYHGAPRLSAGTWNSRAVLPVSMDSVELDRHLWCIGHPKLMYKRNGR